MNFVYVVEITSIDHGEENTDTYGVFTNIKELECQLAAQSINFDNFTKFFDDDNNIEYAYMTKHNGPYYMAIKVNRIFTNLLDEIDVYMG